MALFFFDCGPCQYGSTPSIDVRQLVTQVFRGYYYVADSDIADRLAEGVDAAVTGLTDVGGITSVSWGYRARYERYWADASFTHIGTGAVSSGLAYRDGYNTSTAANYGFQAPCTAEIAQIRFNAAGTLKRQVLDYDWGGGPGFGAPVTSTTYISYNSGDIVTLQPGVRYQCIRGFHLGPLSGPNVCP